MIRFVLIAAVVLVLVQVGPGRAAADIIQYESLDLAVVAADLVVRGEVTEIVSQKGENGVVWNRVTVKVAETIKGKQAREVTFLVHQIPFTGRTTPWRNQRREMLFCLNALKSPQGPFRVDYVLHEGFISWAIALDGAGRGGTYLQPQLQGADRPQTDSDGGARRRGLRAARPKPCSSGSRKAPKS